MSRGISSKVLCPAVQLALSLSLTLRRAAGEAGAPKKRTRGQIKEEARKKTMNHTVVWEIGVALACYVYQRGLAHLGKHWVLKLRHHFQM